MTLYTLTELSKLSGIKASRLRLWKSRYNFPKSLDITESRKYTEFELLRLVNAATLISQGWRVSKILKLSPEALVQNALMLSDISLAKFRYGAIINGLLRSVLEYDQVNFVNLYDAVRTRLDLAIQLEEIDLPLINRMWVLWCSGKVQLMQYYYLRQLLISTYTSQIRSTDSQNSSRLTSVAIYTLHEEDDLIAHFCAAWLHKAKFKVILITRPMPWTSPTHLRSNADIDKVLCLHRASPVPEINDFFSFDTSGDISELIALLSEL